MSAETPSYSNARSSFAISEHERDEVDAGRYVDAGAYGDPYMTLGGGIDPDPGCTPLLEKDYCTNFTCCGLTLADLHELVGHFEECHVMVVGPNGGLAGSTGFPTSLGMHTGRSFVGTQMGISTGIGRTYDAYISTDEPSSAITPQYSSSSTPSTAPSSSLNSPISPYPSPSPRPNRFPTLTSAFTPSETREGESAFASVTIASEGYDHTDDTATDYLATHSQAPNHVQNHAQALSQEQHLLGLSFDTLLHPSAYATSGPAAPASVVPEHTIYASNLRYASTAANSSRPPTYANTASTDVTASLMNSQPIAPIPIYARHPTLSIITDLPSVSSPNSNQYARTADHTSNSKRRRAATTKSASRQREKTYKCPSLGCIKSYLNFNGLKYHLEKGTCDFGQN